jgi:aminobenzoyl-glutamate utilization protein B
VRKLFERAKQIAEGAALMSDTQVTVEVMSAVWPVRGNQTLAELVQREIERVGPPDWTAEEEALARAVQANAKVPVEGLRRSIDPPKGPATQKAAANDAGDISWKVPMVKIYFPANIPNINAHHWAAGVALATSIAHKGALAGAKVLSASVVECLLRPAVVEKARRTFKEELGGVEYVPLLPRDQKPPVDLNRAMMDKYRPLLAAHYVKEKPQFV